MIPSTPGTSGTSTRPYLIRALHDWCTDNGFTPYIAVFVDASVKVPMEYVKNNEIVLNVGFEATTGMKLGNEYIEFKARFGGTSRDIIVPVDHVIAIYARENGQGMAFPAPTEAHTPTEADAAEAGAAAAERPGASGGLRLASTDGQPQAAPAGEGAVEPSSGPADPTPEPPAPGGGRPSLKRIK
ncbi:MAG: ClpXP protease specificity-enhancing factor [Rhizobacter sp.]